jgi:hypothetical protein
VSRHASHRCSRLNQFWDERTGSCTSKYIAVLPFCQVNIMLIMEKRPAALR